jgi:hypothetical protein
MVQAMHTRLLLLLIAAWLLTSCRETPLPKKDQSQPNPPLAAAAQATYAATFPAVDSANSTSSAFVPSAAGDTLVQLDTATNLVRIQCTPAVFTLRDTITVRTDFPHRESLVVNQPDGTPFYLIYPNPAEPSNYLLTSSDAFMQMPTIRFKADVRARPQLLGRDTLERVFSKPGVYVLSLIHKLETDSEEDIPSCKIRLR